jgi:hypothetical protein
MASDNSRAKFVQGFHLISRPKLCENRNLGDKERSHRKKGQQGRLD